MRLCEAGLCLWGPGAQCMSAVAFALMSVELELVLAETTLESLNCGLSQPEGAWVFILCSWMGHVCGHMSRLQAVTPTVPLT